MTTLGLTRQKAIKIGWYVVVAPIVGTAMGFLHEYAPWVFWGVMCYGVLLTVVVLFMMGAYRGEKDG